MMGRGAPPAAGMTRPPARVTTAALGAAVKRLHPKKIDLSLEPDRAAAAPRWASRRTALPPVIHVAGTNGKGSTVAFLRAIAEAAGLKVHVLTSPHLVRFAERIRLAGELITDDAPGRARWTGSRRPTPASRSPSSRSPPPRPSWPSPRRRPTSAIVEVGLGGRFDATNVFDRAGGRGDHPGRLRPPRVPGRRTWPDRLGEGRDHQARPPGGRRPPGRGGRWRRSRREAERLRRAAGADGPRLRRLGRARPADLPGPASGCSTCRPRRWSATTRSTTPAWPSPPCAGAGRSAASARRRWPPASAGAAWPARFQRLTAGPYWRAGPGARRRPVARRRPQSPRRARGGRASSSGWRADGRPVVADRRPAGQQGRAGLLRALRPARRRGC